MSYTPKQDSDVDCLHWHALNYRTAGLDAQGAWVELEAYFDKQIKAAYQAGRASRDAEVEALRAGAEMLDWLDKEGPMHVFTVGNTWYSRIAYGQPYTKHKTLREAVNAARAAQEKQDD